MRQWYALRSRPRKEFVVKDLLSRAEIEVYLPQARVRRHSDQAPVVEPFFPGYLFARLDPALGEIRLASYTPGLLYVVSFGDQPCPVPDDLILSLQTRLASDSKRAPLPDLRPGERLVITSGPLRDREAIFDTRLSASGRVRVLVRILERLCRAEVHTSQLRRVGKAAATA